jgi:hypothetical protein
MKLVVAKIVSVGLGLLLSASAVAGAGDHIKAGQVTITPKVALGVEYSSNPYHSEQSSGGGTNLFVAPGVEAHVEGPDLDVAFGAEYDLRKFFGRRYTRLDRFDQFTVNLALKAFKASRVGFRVNESVGQRNYVADSDGAIPFDTIFRQSLGGGIDLRPSSAFEFNLGGSLDYENYRVVGPTPGDSRAFGGRTTYGPSLGVQWKFFPRTELLLDSNFVHNEWSSNELPLDPDGGLGSALVKPNSNYLRALFGLRGQVTERLHLSALIGYGKAWYVQQGLTPPTDASGFDADVTGGRQLTAEFQATYKTTPDNKFILGYQRGFRDVYFTNYVAYDFVFGRLQNKFTPRLGSTLELGARGEAYRGQIVRNDVVLSAKAGVSYNLADWAALKLGAGYTHRGTDQTGPSTVAFDEFRAQLSGEFTY